MMVIHRKTFCCINHQRHHQVCCSSYQSGATATATVLRMVFVALFSFLLLSTTTTTTTTCVSALDMDAWQLGNQSTELISLENTCFEEYWQDLPSIIMSSIKTDTSPADADAGADAAGVDKNKKVVLQIEGFSFLGRMAIYEFLMFGMDDASLWSSSNSSSSSNDSGGLSFLLREQHWLWAYAAQMDWQHRSGRLNLHKMMSTEKTDRISIESWWGYMNFCFSVAILLGAEQSGVLQEAQQLQVVFAANKADNDDNDKPIIVLEMDPASQMLVEQDIGVQASIDAWANLFRNGYATYKKNVMTMLGGNGNTTTTTATTTATNSSTKDKNRRRQRDDERFRLQQQVWEAHTAVIRNSKASPRFHTLLEKMPPAEQKFAVGWADMVELLAAGCFPTDLMTLLQDGAGFLPLQVLDDYTWSSLQDNVKQLEGLEKRRYTSIVATHDLVDMPPSKKQNIASFWKRISRNYRISRSLPGTIQKLYHGSPLVKMSQLIKLFGLFVRPREWISLGAGLIGALVVRFGIWK